MLSGWGWNRETAKRLLIIALVAGAVALSWSRAVDHVATEQVDAGLKRALVSFGTARALNAAISVIQGTEVSAQPLGFGVNLALGQAIDPLNDLVEQFSQLMLAASVSFGVQRMLIAIGGHVAVSAGLTVAALLALLLYFRRRALPRWTRTLLLVFFALRFAVPFAAAGSDFLFRHFMATEYASGQKAIEAGTERLSTGEEDVGVLERAKRWANVKERVQALVHTAEQLTEHLIRLTVVFLLETLVFPVVLLWAFLVGLRRAAQSGTAAGSPVAYTDFRTPGLPPKTT